MKKILLISLFIIVVLGCSSEETTEDIPLVDQITDSDRVFSIEDFKSVGFKKSKA